MTGKKLIDSVIESGMPGEYRPDMLARGPEGLREALSCLYHAGSAGGVKSLHGLLSVMMAMMNPAWEEDRELKKDIEKLPGYLSVKETLYEYAQVMLDHLDSIYGAIVRKEKVYQECRDFFRKISEEFPLLELTVDYGRYLHEFYVAVGKKDAYRAYERALSELNTVSSSESPNMFSIREMIRSRLDALKDTPEPMPLLESLAEAMKEKLHGKIIYNPDNPCGVCKVDDVYIENNLEYLGVQGMSLFDNCGMIHAADCKTSIKLAHLDDCILLEVEPRKLLKLAEAIAPSHLDEVKKFF